MKSDDKPVMLFFEVEGMGCPPCANRIIDVLKQSVYVVDQEVHVDFALKRASVVVIPGTQPREIIEVVKKKHPDLTLTYIPPSNEYVVRFSLKHLKGLDDVSKLQDTLMQQNSIIVDSSVDWSTKILRVSLVSPDKKEQKKETLNFVVSKIKETLPHIELEEIASLALNEDMQHRQQTKEYVNRVIINCIVGALLLLFSVYIPLPVTALGQMIGLAIGGLTLGVMYVTGREFYMGAWRDFWRDRSFKMNSLISLGTGTAWTYSMMLVLLPGLFSLAALQYQFLAVNMILGIVNFGRAVRSRAEDEARIHLKKITKDYADMQPQWVKRVKKTYTGNFEEPVPESFLEEISYKAIRKGDILQVKPDEYVPVEGDILNDVETSVNQAAMTGESELCHKNKGDKLYSGSLNATQVIYLRADCDGLESKLNELIKESEKSRTDQTAISKKIDVIAKYFVPAIFMLAFFSGCGWFLFGTAPVLPLVMKAITSVLISTCPCTLGLTTPFAFRTVMNYLQMRDVLVKDANAIEALAKANTVVFDKTGTLTHPVYHHMHLMPDSVLQEQRLLSYAARLEQEVDHPIATAFKKMNDDKALRHLPCIEVNKQDKGVSGVVGIPPLRIHLGASNFFAEEKIEIDASLRLKEKEYAAQGMTSVFIGVNNRCVGIAALDHALRHEAKEDITLLKKMGVDIHVATGDKYEIACKVAEELGIEIKNVKAQLSPTEKRDLIQALKTKDATVVMVGDNVNDQPAFNASHVSVAVGHWANGSSSAHVSMKKLKMAELILVSQKTMENIKFNLLMAFGYNLLSVGAAMLLIMGPIAGSISMACSSIFVVLNSSALLGTITKSVDKLFGRETEKQSFVNSLLFRLKAIAMTILGTIFTLFDDGLKEAPPSPRRKTDITQRPYYDVRRKGFFIGDVAVRLSAASPSSPSKVSSSVAAPLAPSTQINPVIDRILKGESPQEGEAKESTPGGSRDRVDLEIPETKGVLPAFTQYAGSTIATPSEDFDSLLPESAHLVKP